MKIVMKRADIDEKQAEETFNEIVEGFQLDIIKSQPDQLKNIKDVLLPCIMRGMIEVDVDNYEVDLYLKRPILIIGDGDDIEKLTFSLHNCEYGKVTALESSATKGEFAKAIVNFTANSNDLVNEKIIRKLCSSDYAASGAISTLFLSF